MRLENQFQCDNTRIKLRMIEEHMAKHEARLNDGSRISELSRKSMLEIMQQLKDEIEEFEASKLQADKDRS